MIENNSEANRRARSKSSSASRAVKASENLRSLLFGQGVEPLVAQCRMCCPCEALGRAAVSQRKDGLVGEIAVASAPSQPDVLVTSHLGWVGRWEAPASLEHLEDAHACQHHGDEDPGLGSIGPHDGGKRGQRLRRKLRLRPGRP